MKKTILLVALLLLAAFPHQAMAQGWTVINQAPVLNRIMPAGTEVKVRIVQISDQFDARLSLLVFAESVFADGAPGTASIDGKSWRSDRMRPGDVVSYTTRSPGFIGLFAGGDYRDLSVTQLERGHLLTMGYRGHRWQVVVIFPDYD